MEVEVMGFFSDLREDLSQAVNELLPDDSLSDKSKENDKEEKNLTTDDLTENDAFLEAFDGVDTIEPGFWATSPKFETLHGTNEILPEFEDTQEADEEQESDDTQENDTDWKSGAVQEFDDFQEVDDEQALDIITESENTQEFEDTQESDEEQVLDATLASDNAPEYNEATESDEPIDSLEAQLDEESELFTDKIDQIQMFLSAQEPQDEEEKLEMENFYEEAMASSRFMGETVAETESAEIRDMLDETAIITSGMTINGDIVSQGSMDVQGAVNGNIDILGKLNIAGHINGNSKGAEILAEGAKINGEVTSEGAVRIGASSVVIGNITAKSAVIAGAVKGDIDVMGPVTLDASAIVMGNIKSKSVQINNGAVIEGMCSQSYAEVSPTSFFDEYKPEIKSSKSKKAST
ncbi:MAG: polymer-forming cytoskeletal protein [Lachnospiraceae bacterium]|jgi:cytoskeletal protein CcmA (bactofilin family)|nr:polymer-forming cytoskeletal protein [Lachnospiraceae bacterium]